MKKYLKNNHIYNIKKNVKSYTRHENNARVTRESEERTRENDDIVVVRLHQVYEVSYSVSGDGHLMFV